MDCGLHICLDDRRLALRRRGHRSVLPAGCRLVDECSDDSTARHRCPGDGDLATRQTRCAAASLRSRQPIHERAVKITTETYSAQGMAAFGAFTALAARTAIIPAINFGMDKDGWLYAQAKAAH